VIIENPEHEDTDLPTSGFWEDADLERLWVEEAERRYQDYLDGKEEAAPGEEAIRRIYAATGRLPTEKR
jgi:hypothetical protein